MQPNSYPSHSNGYPPIQSQQIPTAYPPQQQSMGGGGVYPPHSQPIYLIPAAPTGPKQVRATKEVSRKYANSLVVDGCVVGFTIWLFIFKIIEVILPEIRHLFVEFNLILCFILFLDVLYRLYAYYFIRFLKRKGDICCFIISTLAFICQIIVFMNLIHPFRYYDYTYYSDPLPICDDDDDRRYCTTYDSDYIDPQEAFRDLGVNICNIFVFASILRCWRVIRLHKWFKNRKEEIKQQDQGSSDEKLFDESTPVISTTSAPVPAVISPIAAIPQSYQNSSTPSYHSYPSQSQSYDMNKSSSAPSVQNSHPTHPTHSFPYQPPQQTMGYNPNSNPNSMMNSQQMRSNYTAPQSGARPTIVGISVAPVVSTAPQIKQIGAKYRESPYSGKVKQYK